MVHKALCFVGFMDGLHFKRCVVDDVCINDFSTVRTQKCNAYDLNLEPFELRKPLSQSLNSKSLYIH